MDGLALEREIEITQSLLSLVRSKPQIVLPALYPEQQQIISQAARFNVLAIGRRAGKTYLGQYLALKYCRAGYPVGWFAPNYKYLLEVWQYIERVLKPHAKKVNATERRIELHNGALFECWTLDGTDDPGRSRKYKIAIVDEAAIASRLKAAWEQAIRPTLTDLSGDAWFLSTPKGLNYFYQLFLLGADPLSPAWRAWQMPSSINPFLPAGEIEEARLSSPESVFQQEYLAEFISSEGAVFRNVDACLTAPQTTPGEHAGHLLVAGVDLAQQNDFTAVSVICCHCEREVALERYNQLGWAFIRGRLLQLLKTWGVSLALIESNSIGGPNLEALHDESHHGLSLLGFNTTPKSKPRLIQSLALSFERTELRWLADQVARFELIAYECTLTENGHPKYSAPEGGFDDTVIARALAYHLASARIPVPLTEAELIDQQMPANLRRSALSKMVAEDGALNPGRELAWALKYPEARRAVDEKRRGVKFVDEGLVSLDDYERFK